MKFFSLTQEIAIDLGTANTIIICDDQIVVDEPSVVAIRKADDPLHSVAKGTGIALKNIDSFSFLIDGKI